MSVCIFYEKEISLRKKKGDVALQLLISFLFFFFFLKPSKIFNFKRVIYDLFVVQKLN